MRARPASNPAPRSAACGSLLVALFVLGAMPALLGSSDDRSGANPLRLAVVHAGHCTIGLEDMLVVEPAALAPGVGSPESEPVVLSAPGVAPTVVRAGLDPAVRTRLNLPPPGVA